MSKILISRFLFFHKAYAPMAYSQMALTQRTTMPLFEYYGPLHVSYPLSVARFCPGPPVMSSRCHTRRQPEEPCPPVNPVSITPAPPKPAHLESHPTRPIVLPTTKKKSNGARNGRKPGARSVKNSTLGSAPGKPPHHQKKLGPRPRTVSVPSPSSTNATPPGDKSRSASSRSAPSPPVRRSTRNLHIPSAAHPAHPTPAPISITATPAPLPATAASSSGKRKREDDAGTDANDTSMRPVRRRKPTARALEALEALEEPSSKPRKQRVPRRSREAEAGDAATAGPRVGRTTPALKRQRS